MAKYRTPSFIGLTVASILLTIFGAIAIIVGIVLSALVVNYASAEGASPAAVFMSMLPGVAIALFGLFLIAVGEVLKALQFIAESTGRTAYILSRKAA